MSTKQKIKTLNLLKKFELINRLICYTCVIPLFYTAACLNQKKSISTASKAGCIGFGASVFTALVIRNKEEKIEDELEKIKRKKENSLC